MDNQTTLKIFIVFLLILSFAALVMAIAVYVYFYFQVYLNQYFQKQKKWLSDINAKHSKTNEMLETYSKSSQKYEKTYEVFLRNFYQFVSLKDKISFNMTKVLILINKNANKIFKERIKNFKKIHDESKELKKMIREIKVLSKRLTHYTKEKTSETQLVLTRYQKVLYANSEISSIIVQQSDKLTFFKAELELLAKKWKKEVSYFSEDKHLNNVEQQNNFKLEKLNSIVQNLCLIVGEGKKSLDFYNTKIRTYDERRLTYIMQNYDVFEKLYQEQKLEKKIYAIRAKNKEIEKLFSQQDYVANRERIQTLLKDNFLLMSEFSAILNFENSARNYFEEQSFSLEQINQTISELNKRFFTLQEDIKVYKLDSNFSHTKIKKINQIMKTNFYEAIDFLLSDKTISSTLRFKRLEEFLKKLDQADRLLLEIDNELEQLKQILNTFSDLEKKVMQLSFEWQSSEIVMNPQRNFYLEAVYKQQNRIQNALEQNLVNFDQLKNEIDLFELLVNGLDVENLVTKDANDVFYVISNHLNRYRSHKENIAAMLNVATVENNSGKYVKALETIKEFLAKGEN
ncbi:hypothetical protein ACWXVL_00040 [Mycoplasma sp. 128]|uniref:hypothetical protein n=1 Tax=Mycoplasma sp. 3341 TaxID=3447506 RepID=UPI003F65919A